MSRPRLTPRQIAALRHLGEEPRRLREWWIVGDFVKRHGFQACSGHDVVTQLRDKGLAQFRPCAILCGITDAGLEWLKEHDKT